MWRVDFRLEKYFPKFPLNVLIKGVIRDPTVIWRLLAQKSISEIDFKLVMDLLPNNSTIIEGGASDGSDTEKFLEFKKNAKIFTFEPNPQLFEKLSKRLIGRARCYQFALAPEGKKSISLWVTPDADSSSILLPTQHINYFPKIEFLASPIEVNAMTLDEIVQKNKIIKVDLLWLDLQGAELAVLRSGGKKTLEITSHVHLEVCRVPMYSGAPIISEVVEFMASKGFRLRYLKAPFVFGNALFSKME